MRNRWPILGAAGLAAAGVSIAATRKPGPPVDLIRSGFRRRNIDTPAGCMAVFELGEGRPLILLHGVGGGASSFYWYRLADRLRDRFRIVAPDWVGFGHSDHPGYPLLSDAYVAQVQALLDDQAKPALIVAQSLASGFAIRAWREGAPIAKLAMLAPTGGRDFGEDVFPPVVAATVGQAARVPGVNLLFYRLLFHRRAWLEAWFKGSGFADPRAIPPEIIEASLWSARQPNAAAAALPFLTGALRYDLAPLLADLPGPALMVWGGEESEVRPAIRERLARVNPAVETAVIQSAKTNMEIERPDDVAQVLLRFFE